MNHKYNILNMKNYMNIMINNNEQQLNDNDMIKRK